MNNLLNLFSTIEKNADLLASAVNLAAKNKRITGAVAGSVVGAVAGSTASEDGHRVRGALLGAAAGAGIGYAGMAMRGGANKEIRALEVRRAQPAVNPEMTQRIVNTNWSAKPVPEQRLLPEKASVSKQQMIDSAAIERSITRRNALRNDARLGTLQTNYRPPVRRATEAEDAFITLPKKQTISGPIALGPSTVPPPRGPKTVIANQPLSDVEKQKQISKAWEQHEQLDPKVLAAQLQNPNLEGNTLGNIAKVRPLRKKASMKELVQKYTAKAIRFQYEHPIAAGALSQAATGSAVGGVVGATQDSSLKGTAVGAVTGAALGAAAGLQNKRMFDKILKSTK